MSFPEKSASAQIISITDKLPDNSFLRLGLPNKSTFPSNASIIFLLLMVVFVGFRMWHLTTFSLWTDEIFSLVAARLPWGAMFERLVLDKVHPPLFYVLLKLWIAVGGQSLLWLKLFPLLTSIAAIIPFYLLCRELNLSAFATNVTLSLVAVNGYLIYYAQEVRMYSLLIFFTVNSFWLFARFINRGDAALKKHLLLLFIGNLLLVYTHYFGWLVVGVEGIFLLWLNRQKFLLFLFSVTALVFCYSPWIYVVVNAILTNQGPTSGLDWIGRPGLSSLFNYFAILAGPLDFPKSTFPRLLLFGSPVLIWLWHILKNRQNNNQVQNNVFWWLLISFSLPLAFVFAVSIFSPKSIWHERYLVIVVLPFMLLIGIALDKLRPHWLRAVFLSSIIVWSLFGGMAHINRGNNITRVSWENMVQAMIQSEPADARDVKVFQFETNTNRPVQFYLNELGENRFQTIIVKDVTAIEGNHFWVVFREETKADKNLSPQEVLIKKGYQIDKEFSFGNPGQRVYFLSLQL